jgi:ubiquinone/menaquinone biosynthesis C-methylase UbiE
MPSGSVFDGSVLYCLDPLYGQYISTGFPIHYYKDVKFINSHSENIPINDSYFDVIISVNAIDHVDNFHATAQELKRVLKNNGQFAMHVHYHKATSAEPIEITDELFLQEYSWVKGIRKVNASKVKTGSNAGDGESYVLWRNF